MAAEKRPWGEGKEEMIVYFDGQYLPKDEVRVSPDDRGFTFGDGAYEVIRTYGGRLFRCEDHVRRLARSLSELRIQAPALEGPEGIGHIAGELLRRNGLNDGDAAVYVQVTRGAAPRKHSFPPPGTPPTVYLAASPLRSAPEAWQDGVGIILVPDIRWTRCDIKAVALLPSVLASQQAVERGAEEAVFLRDGAVTEGAHTNFCAIFDGVLVTHPPTNHILDGITRRAVLALCADLGIATREAPIPVQDLMAAEEMMILGTTTEIKPVVQVDGRQVADGRPGPVTRRLQAAFRALVAAETGG
jgi:D-alanine transaminase